MDHTIIYKLIKKYKEHICVRNLGFVDGSCGSRGLSIYKLTQKNKIGMVWFINNTKNYSYTVMLPNHAFFGAYLT